VGNNNNIRRRARLSLGRHCRVRAAWRWCVARVGSHHFGGKKSLIIDCRNRAGSPLNSSAYGSLCRSRSPYMADRLGDNGLIRLRVTLRTTPYEFTSDTIARRPDVVRSFSFPARNTNVTTRLFVPIVIFSSLHRWKVSLNQVNGVLKTLRTSAYCYKRRYGSPNCLKCIYFLRFPRVSFRRTFSFPSPVRIFVFGRLG